MPGPFPPSGATNTALYCNGATQVKTGAGVVNQVSVLVAGAAGTIYDCVGTANLATANEVAVIPATVGVVALNFPCLVGILYVPGASQIASISYQ
jgi:hypothetical protein